ncbi:molybdopterin-guanine dinucleotide biosynthesis protein B [Paenibacillus sp. UNCCL117]|uniref:molybdopterin-guanine dinucleotide biosynthesis protein B n=1 Tax=unclassified Paenibacillus TaxID=185978 RepID=UPI000889A80B|nr:MULTISPECIES: molybdopterin-guanine dinucleotide biosynthesis protein B [unclassified Paenibacillus]SDE29802.1 molybdopterin-guanine dinucleotide biosynthesis protein B [Paenibacillus sp. cl123]SFW63194.1 molybdopterin-guanine dinucleotide biosynthesis protein B [Paenibacillus sp. UNCCL117]
MGKQAILQVVGYKNSGKTTLTCELIKRLKEQGLSVGTVKHDAHRLELDTEGKDSWLHREAGAEVAAVVSEQSGVTFMTETRTLALDELLDRMTSVEVVLVEGFKRERYPKLVLIREPEHLKLLETVTAAAIIATWLPVEQVRPYAGELPVVPIEDMEKLLEAAAAVIDEQLGNMWTPGEGR